MTLVLFLKSYCISAYVCNFENSLHCCVDIYECQKYIAETLPVQGLVPKIRTQFACQTRCHIGHSKICWRLLTLDFAGLSIKVCTYCFHKFRKTDWGIVVGLSSRRRYWQKREDCCNKKKDMRISKVVNYSFYNIIFADFACAWWQ